MICLIIGCISSDNNNKKVPELIVTLVNESDNEINVTMIITDSKDNILYNQTIYLEKAEVKKTEKITDKEGYYNFYLFVDKNRTIDKELRINEEHYPPNFHIKNDEIQIGQKII